MACWFLWHQIFETDRRNVKKKIWYLSDVFLHVCEEERWHVLQKLIDEVHKSHHWSFREMHDLSSYIFRFTLMFFSKEQQQFKKTCAIVETYWLFVRQWLYCFHSELSLPIQTHVFTQTTGQFALLRIATAFYKTFSIRGFSSASIYGWVLDALLLGKFFSHSKGSSFIHAK